MGTGAESAAARRRAFVFAANKEQGFQLMTQCEVRDRFASL
jgi:hypothetical protein